MSAEKRAQYEQKFMANAQRGQAVQRVNNTNMASYMPYVQPFTAFQPVQGYQVMHHHSCSPFSSGFNMSSFGMMNMPFAPMQRPMVPQVYPGPPILAPPPVMFQPQMMNPIQQMPVMPPQMMNQARPMMQPQPMYQNNAQRSQFGQPVMNPPVNPAALLNLGINMNANNSGLGMNKRPGNRNHNNNGW